MPLIEEEIDGLSGLLFPFYDADTHMLYLAGKVVKGGGGMGPDHVKVVVNAFILL